MPLPPLQRAPRLWSLWLLGGFAAALAPVQQCDSCARPLSERNGLAEAFAAVEAQYGPDSFVVIWPPHAAAALSLVPAGLRAADAVPVEHPESRRFTRLLVVGPLGFATPPELADATALPRQRFEQVEVASFTYPQDHRVLFDLRRSLEQLDVRLIGEPELRCNEVRRGGGWSCPGQPGWMHVSPTDLRVEGSPWPSVWAHPSATRTLRLDLGSQQLGDRIELQAALSDGAATTQGGAPVRLRLEVEGIGSRSLLRSNRSGVATVTMPTSPGRAVIRLFIDTTNDARRHLGINLRIIDDRGRGEAGP